MPPKKEKKNKISEQQLPDFVSVGTLTKNGHRSSVALERLKKMLAWWNVGQPALKQNGGNALSISAYKLADEFGMKRPSNGNSFRGSLQLMFDAVEVEGLTMFVSLRGSPAPDFRVTDETTIWFRAVASSERTKKPDE